MIPYERIRRRGLDDLLEYLLAELQTTQGARKGLEDRWIRFQELYRGLPDEAQKTFPWIGASNIVVPIVGTDVDIVAARLLGLLFGPRNLWTVSALRPDMVDYAPRVDEFLRWAQESEIKAYDAVSDWIVELAKLGTGVLKQRYTRESRKVYEWRETAFGSMEQQVRRMIHDHPTLHHVRLPDFYVPATATSHQQSWPWCAERLKLSWVQMQNRVNAGLYQNIQPLGAWYGQKQAASRAGAYDRAFENLDAFRPSYNTDFELYEFWVDFDLDGDGEPEALVCTIHPDTRVYARVDYNPFFNQEKPYSVARYIKQEGRFYGIGLGEILEQFQDASTTMTNQRIDNATLMNMAMYKGRTNAGIEENEPWFPGKVKLLSDPEKDLVPMQVGQKADTTIPNEQLLMTYKDKRSGVNDYVEGNAGQYATATGVTSMLREGAKRFDQVLREVRSALSESGVRILELYQQFNQGGKPFLVMGEKDGQMVQAVLQFPTEIVRAALFVDVTATNGALNKEVEVRTNQIVFGLVMDFYAQLMQGLAIVNNPQAPPMMREAAYQMVKGGTKLARRILDSYGVQDVDAIIPDLEQAVASQQQQLGAIGAPGGPAMGGGPIPPAGVGAVPAGFGATAPGGYLPAPQGGQPAGYLQGPGGF